MNLFVCLVPFLLLTAAFVKFGGVDVELPRTQTAELTPAKPETSSKVDLVFQLDGDRLQVTGYQKNYSEIREDVQASFHTQEISALSSYLSSLIEKNVEFQSSLFRATGATRFEDAVRVISTLRAQEFLKSIVLATEVVN
jgi:biopolymer transport protein ExbD